MRNVRSVRETLRRLVAAAVGLVAWLSVASASAQAPGSSTFLYRERLLEEQLRPLIEPELSSPPAEDRWHIDYGAVLRYALIWFQENGPNNQFVLLPGGLGSNPVPVFLSTVNRDFAFQGSRAVHDWDFRPWVRADLDGVHTGFVRGQLDYFNYHDDDGYRRDHDWRGPFVDLGFYHLDIDEGLRRYGNWSIDTWDSALTLGRQFLFVGRGIALAQVADGILLDGAAGDWAAFAFAANSVRHFEDVDRSAFILGDPLVTPLRSGFRIRHMDRDFFGGQVQYEAWDHHRPYAYVVVNRDHNREEPPDPFQEYDYDSRYWGAGIRGEVLFGPAECAWGIRNLGYFAEYIAERGHSFGVGATQDTDPIHAWAIDTGLMYFWDVCTRPRFLVEYARASGDNDRANPNTTVGGNAAGTTDRGFLSFGFLNTGVSFAPLFANLEFLRATAVFRPFEGDPCRRLDELELGSSFFAYWRPAERGGISDRRIDPTSNDHFLGTEWDLFLNWRLSSDLYLLLNYGLFFPNDSVFSPSVPDTQQFLSLNVTWLF